MSSETSPIPLAQFVLALRDLSDENLVSVQKQLQNSLVKLKETNAILEQEIPNTTDEEALQLYLETIEENKQVIASQESRLEALDGELSKRGLVKDEGVYL